MSTVPSPVVNNSTPSPAPSNGNSPAVPAATTVKKKVDVNAFFQKPTATATPSPTPSVAIVAPAPSASSSSNGAAAAALNGASPVPAPPNGGVSAFRPSPGHSTNQPLPPQQQQGTSPRPQAQQPYTSYNPQQYMGGYPGQQQMGYPAMYQQQHYAGMPPQGYSIQHMGGYYQPQQQQGPGAGGPPQSPYIQQQQNHHASPRLSSASPSFTPGSASAGVFTPSSQTSSLPPSSPSTPSMAKSTPLKPRTSGAIVIKNPNAPNTAIDIKELAASASPAAKRPAVISAPPPVVAASTTVVPPPASPSPTPSANEPVKKKVVVPGVVRLESPAQRDARVAAEKKAAEEEEKEKSRVAKEKETLKKEEEEKEKKLKEEEEKVEKEKAEKEAADAAAKAKSEEEAKSVAEKAEADSKAKHEAEAAAAIAVAATAEIEERAKEAAAANDAAAAAVTPSSTTETPSSLPPKPSTTDDSTDLKKKPASLDLTSVSATVVASSSTSTPTGLAAQALATAVASSLSSAKWVEDPAQIEYPSSVKSPNPALSAGLPIGKIRYERDFLLQFMEICKEKPESLPPLESIGLVADSNESAGGYRGSRGGPSRQNSAGMGRGAQSGFGGRPGQGAGAGFGMGSFGTAGVPKTSSERFAASAGGFTTVGGGRTPMSRQSSQQGFGSVPPSPAGRNSSLDNSRSRSGRGGKRSEMPVVTLPTFPETPVAPLVESANRWVPGASKKNQDERSPEFVDRKVKGLLNKLTMDNFDSISTQILTWANKSEDEKDGQTLRQVIKLIFEKATDEAHWSEMYARLCRKIMDQLSIKVQDEQIKSQDGSPIVGGALFRKYLLNRCQEDFERGWAAKEKTAAEAASKSTEDKAKMEANAAAEEEAKESGNEPKQEAALMSDEYYAAQKAKRQGLGLVRLIGELFKLEMLTERIMHVCVKKLLSNVIDPEEEDIESLCRLLTTVGKELDTVKAKQHLDIYFQRMQVLTQSDAINSRMQFMLLDVIELRSRKWKTRNDVDGVQTIAEVRAKAASDAAKATMEAARSANARSGGYGGNDSMSRGGSRKGMNRNEYGQGPQGGDGWNTVAPPPRPTKAGDLSALGKFSKPTGPGAGFAPTNVFGKKGPKAGETPPLSRNSSSTNMFSLLNGADASMEAPEEPTRKKLVLAPRTVKKDGEDEDGAEGEEATEGEGEQEEEKADKSEEPKSTELTVEEKKRLQEKASQNLKEAMNVRSIPDAILDIKDFPTAHLPILVGSIISFAVDARKPDVDLIVSLLSKATEESLLPREAVVAGFTPTAEMLEDLAVDVPSIYAVFVQLALAAGLGDDDLETLASAVIIEDPENAPLIGPVQKIKRAVEAQKSG